MAAVHVRIPVQMDATGSVHVYVRFPAIMAAIRPAWFAVRQLVRMDATSMGNVLVQKMNSENPA